jgi:hypothetical protein
MRVVVVGSQVFTPNNRALNLEWQFPLIFRKLMQNTLSLKMGEADANIRKTIISTHDLVQGGQTTFFSRPEFVS